MRSSHIAAASSLLLVALMLASSCGSGLPSSVGLGGVEQAALKEDSPRRPRSGAEVEKAGGDDGQSEGGAPPVEEDAGEGEDADDEISIEADAGSDAAPVDATADAPTPACDDTKATLFSCESIQGDCRFMFMPLCEGANAALKAKVAAHFGKCLAGVSQCDPMAMLGCFKEAAQQACPVPSAKTVCADYLSRCGQTKELPEELGADFCEKALSSLKDDLRAPMEQCMQQGCDVGECVKRHLPSP